jgi:hypothetical protein
MRKAAATIAIGITLTGAGTGVAIALAGGTTPRAHAARASACPRAIPLTQDALAPATRAALHAATHTDSAVLNHDRRGEIATSAVLALNPDAPAYRSGDAKAIERLCGQEIARRSVIITLFFPRLLPSASASVTTMYVSRGRTGAYRVWYIPRG